MYESTHTGIIVQLTGWEYPVVIEPATGEVKYDNYEGDWGDINRLREFRQAYAVSKAIIEARKKGYSVTERKTATGDVRLEITMTGRGPR